MRLAKLALAMESAGHCFLTEKNSALLKSQRITDPIDNLTRWMSSRSRSYSGNEQSDTSPITERLSRNDNRNVARKAGTLPVVPEQDTPGKDRHALKRAGQQCIHKGGISVILRETESVIRWSMPVRTKNIPSARRTRRQPAR